MAKIRVLTIDDSALMRQVLAELLSKDPDIEGDRQRTGSPMSPERRSRRSIPMC